MAETATTPTAKDTDPRPHEKIDGWKSRGLWAVIGSGFLVLAVGTVLLFLKAQTGYTAIQWATLAAESRDSVIYGYCAIQGIQRGGSALGVLGQKRG